MKYLPLLLIALILQACAARPSHESLQLVSNANPTHTQTIYVASTRERKTTLSPSPTIPSTPTLHYTNNRAEQTNYARYHFSIPPTHQPTKIEWTNKSPNPQHHFTVLKSQSLTHQDFLNDIAPPNSNEPIVVGIFVHGFNNNFAESLLRTAQMSHDVTVEGKPVLFSWPSQGSIRGYLADKESILYSRDNLTNLIIDFSKRKNIKNITIIAHSMGAMLVTESLRQIRLQNNDTALQNVRVILAMPDIDQDVFKNQISTIGRMRLPITLLVTPDDLALSLAHKLAFMPRTGSFNVRNPELQMLAQQNNIRIIDVTAIPSSNHIGHDRYVNIAAIFPELIKDTQKPDNPYPQHAGTYIFDAITGILISPLELIGRTLGSSPTQRAHLPHKPNP